MTGWAGGVGLGAAGPGAASPKGVQCTGYTDWSVDSARCVARLVRMGDARMESRRLRKLLLLCLVPAASSIPAQTENCTHLLAPSPFLTELDVTRDPLIAPVFGRRLDTTLEPREGVLSFLIASPEIGQRFAVELDDMNIRVVFNQDSWRIANGGLLHEGIPIDGTVFHVGFIEETGRLLFLQLTDLHGWVFGPDIPNVSRSEAAEVVRKAASAIMAEPEVRELRGTDALTYVPLPARRFVLAWSFGVVDRLGSVFDGRIMRVDAIGGEILYAGPSASDTNLPNSVRFVRGDANADGVIDLSDPITILSRLFLGGIGEFECADAVNANADGDIDISDGILLLHHLFHGARPPPPPFPGCGLVLDGLGCYCYPAECP